MSELLTSPIGKQQIIDLRAGAILTGNRNRHSKSGEYLGCSARLLLALIIFTKASIFGCWLLREHYYFDHGCVLANPPWPPEDLTEDKTEFRETILKRLKRDVDDEIARKAKKRPLLGASRIGLTTMVTMTNTQILPAGEADEASVKMKTIRNRVETIIDEDSDDTMEVDEDAPPRIYVSKIISRNNIEYDETVEYTTTTTTIKPKRQKGQGRKKQKEEERRRKAMLHVGNMTNEETTTQSMTTTTTTITDIKKERKKGRRKDKMRGTTSEMTKSPRHLFSPISMRTTTIRPHQSNFLHGAIDPLDPKFSNQGQIRGYQMHPATKKPNLRVSDQTRLMWDLDEHNYTTLAAAPKTTAMSGEIPKEESAVLSVAESTTFIPTTTTVSVKKDFYASHKVPVWKSTTPPITSTKKTFYSIPSSTLKPRINNIEQDIIQTKIPETPKEDVIARRTQMERIIEGTQTTQVEEALPTVRNRPIKHGFDRGLDDEIDQGRMTYPIRIHTTTVPTSTAKQVLGIYNFQDQLTSFTSSAICIARTLFDLWCIAQLISSLPYLFGICLARRYLFFCHVVFDILFLVISFIFSITIVVFSIVLYILVDDMHKSTLFQWLLFALLLDGVLLAYTVIVAVSLRCCERILQRRSSGKEDSEFALVSTGDVV